MCLTACQKSKYPNSSDDQGLSKAAQAYENQSVNSEDFTNDSLTKVFILKSTEVKQSSINIEVLLLAIADDTISEVEMEEVAIAFGFSSSFQFIDYLSVLHDLKSQLFEKYQLNDKDHS